MPNAYSYLTRFVIDAFQSALVEFYESDLCQLPNGASGPVNERAMVFRIAHYMARSIEPAFRECNLKVDSEYNRHGGNPKRRGRGNQPKKLIIPDIVVHQRGVDQLNILVVEAKKTDDSGLGNNSERNDDEKKLKCCTVQNGAYCYQLGFYLELDRGEAFVAVFEDDKNKLEMNYSVQQKKWFLGKTQGVELGESLAACILQFRGS